MAETFRLEAALRSRLGSNLRAFERLGSDDAGRSAAVAVALVSDEEERACFVLTRRAEHLPRHGGQWALPGGVVDPGESAQAGALRELREEVGLSVTDREVLGLLDDYPTRSGYVITPVVVWAGHAPPLTPDPREVQAAYRVPLEEIDRPETPVLTRIPESDRPVLSLPFRGDLLHAPTAAILYQLLEVAIHGRRTRVAHFEQPVFAWR